MVVFLHTDDAAVAPAGWTKRAMKRRYVAYKYPPLSPQPAGRLAMTPGPDAPSSDDGTERVYVYRNVPWGPHNPRDKRWYMDTADPENLDELLDLLLEGDTESYLVRDPEAADAEDHITFCRLAFKFFAKGPIVERFEALTLVDPKSNGGFFIGNLGPYHIDFPDRDRIFTARLTELPPKISTAYVRHLFERSMFDVISVTKEAPFKGFYRSETMLVSIRIPPNVAPPKEITFPYNGIDVVVPLVQISNRSMSVMDHIGTIEEPAEGERALLSLEAPTSDATGSEDDSSGTDSDDARLHSEAIAKLSSEAQKQFLVESTQRTLAHRPEARGYAPLGIGVDD